MPIVVFFIFVIISYYIFSNISAGFIVTAILSFFAANYLYIKFSQKLQSNKTTHARAIIIALSVGVFYAINLLAPMLAFIGSLALAGMYLVKRKNLSQASAFPISDKKNS